MTYVSEKMKMFLSPRWESNPLPFDLRWDTPTIELPGLRWQREGHDEKDDREKATKATYCYNSSLDISVNLINRYIWNDLQLGKLKVNCLLLKLNRLGLRNIFLSLRLILSSKQFTFNVPASQFIFKLLRL